MRLSTEVIGKLPNVLCTNFPALILEVDEYVTRDMPLYTRVRHLNRSVLFVDPLDRNNTVLGVMALGPCDEIHAYEMGRLRNQRDSFSDFMVELGLG